ESSPEIMKARSDFRLEQKAGRNRGAAEVQARCPEGGPGQWADVARNGAGRTTSRERAQPRGPAARPAQATSTRRRDERHRDAPSATSARGGGARQVHHLRAASRNAARAYGGAAVLAQVMGVAAETVYNLTAPKGARPTGILAIRLARAAG